MKKLPFLSGALIGFVLGSKAGRGPYNDLDSLTRSFLERPKVKKVVDQAKHTVKDQAVSLTHRAGRGVTSSVTQLVRRKPDVTVPYADPQDLQFGSAAADKAETLDRMLDRGVSVNALHDEPASLRPRAGAKADPADNR